jgi:uncharacterized protein YjgD (DUF1641 family)
MDAKFFQFWNDFIQHTGSSPVGPNNLTGWMSGAGIPDEFMTMFKKSYGLDHLAMDAPEYSALYESALKEFNHSLSNFHMMLDVVPKHDFLDLEKKYKALKMKVSDLEEVVAHLKLLFKTSTPNVEEGIGSMNKMLKSQNEHFLKMMENLGEFYGITKDKDPEEK